MYLPNKDVRDHAQNSGVRLWQLAIALGISDNTLFRRLRVELDEDTRYEYCCMIDAIACNNQARERRSVDE